MNQKDWLTRQILPGTNRYLYGLKSPLGWLLVAVIGSLLAATTLSPQMWLIFGLLLGLIVLGICWPLLAIHAVSCELKFDRRRCVEKSMVRVRLLVTNRLWIPVWGLALEKGFFAGKMDDPDSEIAIALARIPAASTTEFVWEFQPPRRGKYPTVVPDLACGFPFGIWFARKPITEVGSLLVWPETFRLGLIPPAQGRHQLVSETHTDRSGTVGDRIGVRPYRPGDSLRLVRWPQSARFDELIVSEQQSPARQQVSIVLDPVGSASDPHSGNAGPSRVDPVEDCVRIAASICAEFHSHGYQVRILFAGEDILVDARDSSFRSLMDRLSTWTIPRERSHANALTPVSNKSINKSNDKGIGFVVTNSHKSWDGEPNSLGSRYQRVLVVDPADASPMAFDTGPPAWIVARAGSGLKNEFPRQWVRNCHSSWQVSG